MSKPTEPRPPYCRCCGATEGEPHHDSRKPLTVKLRQSSERNRLECQLCFRGLQLVEKDRQRNLTEVADITEALRTAADAVEDIDSPVHYSADDLIEIERKAKRYRALAARMGRLGSNWHKLRRRG